MQSKSATALWVFIFASLGTCGLLIGRIIGWIDIHWITVLIACFCGGVTSFFAIREYRRKAFVREYSHSDWEVKDSSSRKGIFIRIPKSEHGSGNKPKVSFEDRGVMYKTKFEVHYEEGDVLIYHPENSFSDIQFSSFVVRVV